MVAHEAEAGADLAMRYTTDATEDGREGDAAAHLPASLSRFSPPPS